LTPPRFTRPAEHGAKQRDQLGVVSELVVEFGWTPSIGAMLELSS
jgi:hypothetical protein